MNDFALKKIGLSYFYPIEFECDYFNFDFQGLNPDFLDKIKEMQLLDIDSKNGHENTTNLKSQPTSIYP